MALQSPFGFQFSLPVVKQESPTSVRFVTLSRSFNHSRCRPASGRSVFSMPHHDTQKVYASKSVGQEVEDEKEEPQRADSMANAKSHLSDSKSDDGDDDPFLMTTEKRAELRRKIRETIAAIPDVEEEQDPEERRRKVEKLIADYPLVVEQEDPDWPEDADGRGFNLDQFFDKITIKNVRKDRDDENYDSDKEIVWQDDNYIRPIKDITTKEWENTVFIDFNPLVVLVHNRYRRPKENEKARVELDKAIQTFWEAGLPSPRCVAVDAVVQQDLVSALKVSSFPEVIFTKAGKILYRDKVVRTADEWSKIMAFFYYKAVRPPFLDKAAGQNQERIPSL